MSESEHEEVCRDVKKGSLSSNVTAEKDRRVYDITFARGHSAVFVTRLFKMFMPEYEKEINRAFEDF